MAPGRNIGTERTEFRKKPQYSKNNFSNKCQYSKNGGRNNSRVRTEFRKKYQCIRKK
jgi:hypothetical protein